MDRAGANCAVQKPICGVRDDSGEAAWLRVHFSTTATMTVRVR